MRDFEFIHAAEDVPRTLGFAAELGLIVRHDEPTPTPEPRIVPADKLATFRNGVFFLYRPEWVFGEFRHFIISGGHYEGQYDQSPSTNYVSLTLYFAGERKDGAGLRLGGGTLGRDVRWLRTSDHTLHPAPPDVNTVFDTIRKHIDTGKRLRGGVHNYAVLESAWEKLIAGSALPPFDYIEWPPKETKA